MKQLDDTKLCKCCWGCNKLEIEHFEGVMNCKDFIPCGDMTEYYNKLKEMKKIGNLQYQ